MNYLRSLFIVSYILIILVCLSAACQAVVTETISDEIVSTASPLIDRQPTLHEPTDTNINEAAVSHSQNSHTENETQSIDIVSIVATTAVTSDADDQLAEATSTSSKSSVEVHFNSDFSGAAIKINGQNIGETPLSVTLPISRHEVIATLAGFQPWREEVEITETTTHIRPIFEFTPIITQLTNNCAATFWWAEDNQSVYYVPCDALPNLETDLLAQQQLPPTSIRQIDLQTGEEQDAVDVWPQSWIPKKFWEFVPDDISHYAVSPSGEQMVYFRKSLDGVEIDEIQYPEYYAVVVSDNNPPVELGPIHAIITQFSWSSDENRLFFRRDQIGIFDGYLIDIEKQELSTWNVPEFANQTDYETFFGAKLLPDGSGVLFSPGNRTLTDFVFTFETGELRTLSHRLGLVWWLDNNHAFVNANCTEQTCDDSWYWYDYTADILILIISEQEAGFEIAIARRNPTIVIAPNKHQMLATEFSSGAEGNSFTHGDGLWLVEFDSK